MLLWRWYHTGALNQDGVVSRHLRAHYYAIDAHAAHLPDSRMQQAITEAGPRSLREAFSALSSQLLREELYAEDNSALAAHPYQVSESNYQVMLLQAAGSRADTLMVADAPDNRFAAFRIHPLAILSYHYERNPEDPRILHDAVLAVDDYGYGQLDWRKAPALFVTTLKGKPAGRAVPMTVNSVSAIRLLGQNADLTVTFNDPGVATFTQHYIKAVDYNAQGYPIGIDYGNEISTHLRYHPQSQRLQSQTSIHGKTGRRVQDLQLPLRTGWQPQ